MFEQEGQCFESASVTIFTLFSLHILSWDSKNGFHFIWMVPLTHSVTLTPTSLLTLTRVSVLVDC